MAPVRGTMTLFLIFLTNAVLASNSPISVDVYKNDHLKTGFSTNYFKTLDFSKYNKKNLEDVKAREFTNLRLRCRADLDGFVLSTFLGNLETVVNDCISLNVVPVISWVHHEYEANATDEALTKYLNWWEAVAKRFNNTDYRLSFNLFTELGIDGCGDDCSNSLRENTAKYNDWTAKVVKKIRDTGGNNAKRIIILGSPKKTAKDLSAIDKSIYENDSYMMAEWHIYASGPNKKLENGEKSQKYWEGNGTVVGQSNVNAAIKEATDFTTASGLKTYLGAWMPWDNKEGALNQTEIINFGKFFASRLREESIPWSMNVLDAFYDTKKSAWITGDQDVKGATLDLVAALDEIKAVM